MKHKRIKVTFEYSSPNTSPTVSVFTAIFGIAFVMCLAILCILMV